MNSCEGNHFHNFGTCSIFNRPLYINHNLKQDCAYYAQFSVTKQLWLTTASFLLLQNLQHSPHPTPKSSRSLPRQAKTYPMARTAIVFISYDSSASLMALYQRYCIRASCYLFRENQHNRKKMHAYFLSCHLFACFSYEMIQI